VLMEHDVRVAGGTADIETGQLLVIKRCLCPVILYNYKCLNIGVSHNSALFYSFVCQETTKSLHATSGLFIHAGT